MCRQSTRWWSQEQLKLCIAGYTMPMIKVSILLPPFHPNFMSTNNIIFSMQNVKWLFVYLVPWGVDLQLVEWDRDRTLNPIPVLHRENPSLLLFLLSISVVEDYLLQEAERSHGQLVSGTTSQSETPRLRSTTEERYLGEWGVELHTTPSILSGQTTMAHLPHTTQVMPYTSWSTLANCDLYYTTCTHTLKRGQLCTIFYWCHAQPPLLAS